MQNIKPCYWLSDLDLAARYHVHRITIWRWSKDGRLPPPRKLGPATTRWCAAEIETHDEAMLASGTAADHADAA